MDTLNKLKSIQKVQKTIDALLHSGKFAVGGKGLTNNWVLEPFHQGKSCSVGFVHIKDKKAGPCAEHVHQDAREFLIVVTGSVMLNVNGNDVRVLEVGDCGVVDAGDLHYSRPLSDDTKLVYVCIPADAGMDSLFRSIEETQCPTK